MQKKQQQRLKKVEILSTCLMYIYKVDKYPEKNLTKRHQVFSGKVGKLFYHIVIYWKIMLNSVSSH